MQGGLSLLYGPEDKIHEMPYFACGMFPSLLIGYEIFPTIQDRA